MLRYAELTNRLPFETRNRRTTMIDATQQVAADVENEVENDVTGHLYATYSPSAYMVATGCPPHSVASVGRVGGGTILVCFRCGRTFGSSGPTFW